MIAYDYRENKNRFHKKYAVTYTFKPEYRTEDPRETDKLIHLIMKKCYCLNKLWLVPEHHPSDNTVHYHGTVDVKDMFQWCSMRQAFEHYGSFHMTMIYHEPGWEEYVKKAQRNPLRLYNINPAGTGGNPQRDIHV